MKSSYPNYRLAWLTDPPPAIVRHDYSINNCEIKSLPIDAELGSGTVEQRRVGLGINLIHWRHQFKPSSSGKLIQLVEFASVFTEPTFVARYAYNGQFCHRDDDGKTDLIFSSGMGIFRYGNHISTKMYLDGSSNSEMISLQIGKSTLNNLFGKNDAEELLIALDLNPPTKSIVRSVPYSVSELMQVAMDSKYHGSARNLYTQAKVLESLANLLSSLHRTKTDARVSNRRMKIVELHDYLTKLEGKLPTLTALSHDFGISARIMNEEFVSEYGESIFSFITGYRLDQAHHALESSNTSMKIISANLGYSHVNHFITAFRRKFGYSPGKLRHKDREVIESLIESREVE